ncbi:MAG: type VI secretion system tip protein TssI/VgrG [Desulfatiglandaceae bacterium]
MTEQERIRFTFVSHGLPEDTFQVVRFQGDEGISKLYEFAIQLVSEDPEIDLGSVLQNPATLTIFRNEGDDRLFHGIPSLFEQLHEDAERVFYKTVLVPRLWQADLYHENQLFLDKTVPDIIEEILRQAGLTTNDYELRLTNTYPQWEYICQYGETDFDFISRWMEREGIYYYFQQTEEFEKLIITDNASSHENIPDASTIEYHPPSSLRAREEEIVRDLICRKKMLPRKVILRDYNYRRPDLELRGEAEVASQGRGDVYIYGEHFKTPEEGNALAGIRAEEILCRESIFNGESTAPNLCPGFVFELAEHYRDTYNERFLIVELEHEGNQTRALFGTDQSSADEDSGLLYVNRFGSIPADLQYRPERKTPKPRFYGSMNAKVDATDGQYAEIDDEGRYKVRLFFDQSDRGASKASRWVRMAQPYSGRDYGMHFPLHGNTEVLLTFVNGDLDRPVIAGSVPNPDTASPVNSNTNTLCMIKTGGGNQIHTEDKSGSQLMKLQSPTDKTFVRIGAADSGGPSGIEISTKANQKTQIDKKRSLEVGGDTDEHFKGNVKTKTLGDKQSTTVGKTESKKLSDAKSTTVGNEEILNLAGLKLTAVGQSEQTKVAGERALFVGSWDITGIAGNTSIWVGTKSQITIALASEIYVGGKSEVFVGAKSSIAVGGASEIFIGLKSDIKIGGLFELVVAVKLAITVAASLELAAGPKLVNTPTGIKNEGIELSQSAIKSSMAGLTNFF